jgi:hypothetical protein
VNDRVDRMNRAAATISSTVLLRPSGVALNAFSKD